MRVDDINRPDGTVFEFRAEGLRLWCDLVRYVPRKYWFGEKRVRLEYLWVKISDVKADAIESEKHHLAKQVVNAYNVRQAVNS